MPHIDELLGAATFVSAGLVAALSLQPLNSGSAQTAVAGGLAAVAATSASDSRERCGVIDIVVRRSGEASGNEQALKSNGACAKDAPQPHA